ncbi:MAG TPA: ABC transporter ATP-binding protein [Vicinamibacteria bacterium]|nr:ABC transporter ATP-binding protein [Vicinamibacteria bacterium]
MGEVLLQARELQKSYTTAAGELPVLRGVDLEVAAGEMVAIVGASGVGKSTLLHVLGTIDRPDAGSLRIAGEDVLGLSEARRCAFRNRTLGFVFQFHHLLPEFSALENVSMPLLIARVPVEEARSRARLLLEEVGLADRTSHRPGALSGGEQQRVAVARALAAAPRALLADEPTGDLDRASGRRLHETLQGLSRARGLTVVVVTHNDELARRCDRVLRLEAGRLVPD